MLLIICEGREKGGRQLGDKEKRRGECGEQPWTFE